MLATIGVDLATIVMTVFVTSSIPASQQGIAGGVVNSVLQLGVAFCLGPADILQTKTEDRIGLALSYKNTFWFGTAAGAVSLLILAIFTDVPKAAADMTADEKAELAREAIAECEAPQILPVKQPERGLSQQSDAL